MSHIPPNLLECSTIWSEVYRALIARYNYTIRGQFFGHTHNDQFVVYTHSITKEPTSILLEAPSLSPIMSHQPAFRVYEVNRKSLRVTNYLQYSANLVEANKHKDNDVPWQLSYNFTN
jgi:sphingomyelin phosphodiesterase